MISIGIKRSCSVELVDATLVNGEIIPSQCPGDLRISCNVCSHAWTDSAATVRRKSRPEKRVPFTVCHWHDARTPGEPTPDASE